MYAIIKSGSKQHRVVKNDIIDIDLMEKTEGTISFKEVLFLHSDKGTQIGQPYLSHVKVEGKILQQTKGPKEITYKYKKRKNYRRKVGHRQKYLRVQITEIQEG